MLFFFSTCAKIIHFAEVTQTHVCTEVSIYNTLIYEQFLLTYFPFLICGWHGRPQNFKMSVLEQ